MISIIIPVLKEAHTIVTTLKALQTWRERGHQIIVVDGESQDDIAKLAQPLADKILITSPGRARQMNTGAEHAQGEVLLFLHADTQLPTHADRIIMDGLKTSQLQWGHFDVRLSGNHFVLRLVETLMNFRSRLTSIATGDQCIFVKRSLFKQLGEYPDIPLMEDIALCKRLKKFAAKPLNLSHRVVTSSRRWEQKGVWRTIFLMWRLRLAYALGEDPKILAERYYPN
jgi:rSAM/selenodomain-associated transferase 2